MFETADTRAMTGARVYDHDRWLGLVEAVFQTVLADPGDAQQGIVGGPRKLPAIEDHLVVEVE